MRKESDTNPFVNCLICKEDKQFVSIGSCDHHKVCLYCTMKSRLLYDEKKCPICNTHLDYVYILDFKDLTNFKELDKNKDQYYEDDDFNKSGIYYTEIEAKEIALQLRGFNCPIKSCKSEAFENLQSLSTHLNKVHKRYYCDSCLKENKLFLSEMEIYQENALYDHIEYGEYSYNVLLSPPHPECPFCKERFYNDEKLFKHMDCTHFVCQLCKDKHNIIFYSVLSNLLEHYKNNHYCCYYQECLQDIYVVFEKEEELISHLITKHKVTNAEGRLQEIMFQNKAKKEKEGKVHHSKDEFNFSSYIQNLKQKSENYNKEVSSKKTRYIPAQETRIGDDGIEYVIEYTDSYRNNYNNYNRRGGGRGRGGKQNRGRYNDSINNYNKNQYNRGGYHYNSKENNNTRINKYDYKDKKFQPKKAQPPVEEYQKPAPQAKKLDYSFIFNFYLKVIKEYVKKKITNEKLPEEQIVLPKETIYQLIIVIDKMETFQKLLELTLLHNFGIDLEINKELKQLTCEGECDEGKLTQILDKLPIKKVLIVYKYITTSSKKVDGLFYKLDIEEINSNLYDDFIDRPKKIIDNLSKEKRERYNLMKSGFDELGKSNKPKITSTTSTHKPISKLGHFLEPQPEDIKEEQRRKEEAKAKRSKLSQLLDGDNQDDPKKKKTSGGGFKMSNFNLDEDFPAWD